MPSRSRFGRARDRAAASHVTVDWINADVTRLAQLGLAPGFTLVFDRGCYHGLNDRQRAAYAAAVTTLSTPGADPADDGVRPKPRAARAAGRQRG